MYSQIDSNKQKTFWLLFAFVLLVMGFTYVVGIVWTGDAYGGVFFAIFGFVLSLLSSLISYFWGDSIVLSMTGAIDVTEDPRFADLNQRVEILATKAGIPKPRVHILPDQALNAFATGRNPENSHVAITQGMYESFPAQELEGVIAHELSHIKNYDIRLMLIVSVIAGVLTFLADFFLRSFFYGGSRSERKDLNPFVLVFAIIFAILAPVISVLIQMAISRKREFLADMSAVEITRYPQGLTNALKRLRDDTRPVEHATEGNAHMFIDFPLKDAGNFLQSLFSTHPPIEERIAVLERM